MAIHSRAPRELQGRPRPGPSRASAEPPRAPRARVRRWLAGALGLLAALALPAFGAVWFLGGQLDRPWLKARLLAFSRDELGLRIDYDGLKVSPLSGIRARSLRLLTPPVLEAGAPEFVRIDELELDAPLWSWVLGRMTIDALRAARIELSIVRDASGRTSPSELFPADPEARADDTPARPSRLLAGLPRLSIDALDVGHASARFIELCADGSRRVSSLSSFGLRGSLHAGEAGLAGTVLEVLADPLVLTRSEEAARAQATLVARLRLRADDGQTLALHAAVNLIDQSFSPDVGWRGPLFDLDATLHFDEHAARTTISVAALRAFDGRLALDGRSELHDGAALRVVTSGTAHVDLAQLPLPVEGLALDGLQLDLASRELAWDGARVGGSLDYRGKLRGAAFDGAQGSARIGELSLEGQGAFQPDGGRFRAALKLASVALRSAESSADAAGLTLDLTGTTRELAGAQQLDAQARLAVSSARAAADAGRSIALDAAELRATVAGSLRDFAARLIPELDVRATIERLGASDGLRRAALEQLALTSSIRRLARDAAAPLGVQGDADVTLSIPRLELVESARPRDGRAALSLTGVSARAELPLGSSRAAGALSLASLRTGGGVALEGVALDADVDAPLGWGGGGARARVTGRIARFDAGGGSRGTLDEIRLLAHEPEPRRYRLELDAAGSSLRVAGLPLPGELAARLRADAEPAAGVLSLTGGLRGERGARLDLALDARFERASEHLDYTATLGAEKLEAFAALVSEVSPPAGRVRLDGAQLRASAHGGLSGVLVAGDGALPTLAERPLRTARGSQAARLELEGLDYRGEAGSLRVPSLALELESTHRGEAGGSASARLRLPELALDGGGTSLRLRGVDQALVASFERAPDEGVVDVDTALEIESLAQSWQPAFPVRGLRLSSNVQIDRLRSIFLRELALDNPASGSGLRAAGTLELLARGSLAGGKTIVGREALSFEGRLIQELEPLERLGVASHASGTLELPFRLESGGLLGYRLLAWLEAKQVSFAHGDGSFAIEQLDGRVPVVEEFALLESGPVISAGPRTSPLSDTRFFDVHPFLSGNDYVTARSIQIGGLAPLGPLAGNVRVERSDFIVDQLQTGYRGGQIVGQVRAAWRDGDPIVRLRLNATGVRSDESDDVFDANAALTFVPAAMTLEGKMQIVRASRGHLEDILDVLDPFHESANANRVRRGLALGYPKFVRFQLHDGAVDTKVELGGLAQLVRIDEIKAVPLGPILQKYVAPALSGYFQPARASTPAPAGDMPIESALRAPASEQP